MASTIHQQHHTLWRPTKYNKAWTGITGTWHPQITGQQCIWPYLHLPGNQVNTHSVWIPSKFNPAQGNPRRKWCRLASPFSWKCLQKLSQNRGDTERPSEKVRKIYAPPNPPQLHPPQPITKHSEEKGHATYIINSTKPRKKIRRPNRTLTFKLPTWVQMHNGHGIDGIYPFSITTK